MHEAILGTVFGDLLRQDHKEAIRDINLQVAPRKLSIRNSTFHTANWQVRVNGLVKICIYLN